MVTSLTMNQNTTEMVLISGGPLGTAPGVLTDSARARITRSVPAETRRAYAGDLGRFESWCELHGVHAMPTASETLASYLAHLADIGRAPATIERALAAILKAHAVAGLGRPDTLEARAVIRTAQRDAAETGRQLAKASAVTVKALRAMVTTCDATTLIGLRDRAVLILGFALAARRSELARLDLSDVVPTDDGLLITVRISKTGAGREVAVPYKSRAETCPVRTVLAWIEGAGITNGPLFPRIDRHGHLGRVPTGRGSPDGRMTGQAIAMIVSRAAERAGLMGEWSGHSLRRGFATEARRAGSDLIAIGRQGGWQDGSRALLGYFEEIDRWAENPLIGIPL
jgi:site-specific recombinase XerD